NGDTWQMLPSPFWGARARLISGQLIAFGASAANLNESLIAVLDGATWRTLEVVQSPSGGVTDLQGCGDGIVIAGQFISIGGAVSHMFARLPSIHCCGSADFNADGDTGTDLDIEAFFACLAGACCPVCGSPDFD